MSRLRVHSFAVSLDGYGAGRQPRPRESTWRRPAILLGSGECLLEGIDAPKVGYQCTAHIATPETTHFVITKRA
jgi:hypothetical protein